MSFYVAWAEEFLDQENGATTTNEDTYIIGIFSTRKKAERACDKDFLKKFLYDTNANISEDCKKDPVFYRAGTTDEHGNILNSWFVFYNISEIDPDSYEYSDATGTMIFTQGGCYDHTRNL